MARIPDMPCAVCGRPMWRRQSSLPEGQATCQPCRRLTPEYAARQEALAITAARRPEQRSCRACLGTFETRRPNQVYCSPSCRESVRRWTEHDDRMTAEERGYGREHRETRKRWTPIVAAGEASCCLCGYPIDPTETWHLDHTPDRNGYRGVAHAHCNIHDGARRGGRRGNANRAEVERACVACGAGFLTKYARQVYCSAACRPKQQRKVRPAAARPQPHCMDCGCATGAGKRCAPCARVWARTQARNQYRSRVGIPIDAPLWTRA